VLHDAGLVSVELDWVAGTMRMAFIPHESYPDQPSRIEARGLQRAEFPRTNDWGPSNSILEAREPTVGADGL
jgi:hypothetical protein